MPAKTKQTQVKDFENISERDSFYSPRYATELLVPFLRKQQIKSVWECASGHNHIARVLSHHWIRTYPTDLNFDSRYHVEKINFLKENPSLEQYDAIVTNPPFSLKQEFYERCMEIGKAWALLIPADYSGWLIGALQNGCQRITPSRRIDYITPNTIKRVNEKFGTNYSVLEDIPVKMIRKVSSSDFHSYWLTWGLNLPKDEVFVELSNSDKDRLFL